MHIMNTTEIIIGKDGTVTERIIKERTLKVQESAVEILTANVTRPLRQALSIPGWGVAHANVGAEDTVWSVPIDRIPLSARFGMVDGVLVPKFASTTEMSMPLVWKAPKSVRLIFALQTQQEDKTTVIQGNWLFAFNQAGNGFRLPLPNLHDDCRICMGAFPLKYPSAQECVVASLQQFNQSKWNSDLMRTVEAAQKFFRFQPTNETFETLPIDSPDWTKLCDKVSTALMERIML
jgi:hypothetical protein